MGNSVISTVVSLVFVTIPVTSYLRLKLAAGSGMGPSLLGFSQDFFSLEGFSQFGGMWLFSGDL